MKLIPRDEDDDLHMDPEASKMKGLDLIGVFLLTSALVLFIYSITTGSAGKWVSAGVLVPVFVAFALFIGFFYYESKIPVETAALYVFHLTCELLLMFLQTSEDMELS